MPPTLVLRPCAKINLTLHVGEARPDGFHEVRTLLQSIALADRLTLTMRKGPFVLTTRARGVPTDRTNLVWRAAALLWRAAGRPGQPAGVQVSIEKRIPVAAGLGGGSADAAAALAGLNVLWNTRLPPSALARLGATIGSDVPFFLQGGTALGTGRGDELYPVNNVRRLAVVILKPAFGVSAGAAYRWLDEDRRAGKSARTRWQRPVEIDVGWPAGALVLANDLEAPVARRYPAIRAMVAVCVREGALAAAMTGSGSAVFGLFDRPPSGAALARLRRPGWDLLMTRTVSRREAVTRLGVW